MKIDIKPNQQLSNTLWKTGRIVSIISALVYITWAYNKFPQLDATQQTASYGSLGLMVLINLVGLIIGWNYPKEGGIVVGTMSLMIFFYGINARNNFDTEITFWSGLAFLPASALLFGAGLLQPQAEEEKKQNSVEEEKEKQGDN